MRKDGTLLTKLIEIKMIKRENCEQFNVNSLDNLSSMHRIPRKTKTTKPTQEDIHI